MSPRNRRSTTDAQRASSEAASSVGSARATIRDVASAAGVSIGTVSRALNDRPGVHPDTRQRVLATVARLAYDRDDAARELSVRRPLQVALSTAYGHRRLIPFFVLFLEHLSEALAAEGLRVRDVPSGPDGLPQQDADAFVLLGAHPDDPRIPLLEARARPFVLVGHRPGVRCVAADDAAGGALAARHLLRLGHRDLVHVTGELHSQAFADRARGFDEALLAEGLTPPRPLVCDDLTALGAYRALRRHLDAGHRPSAIFAATDEMAIGCRTAALDLDLHVPLDLSVVGFDDMPEVGDDLTTVRQDIPRLAAVTVELLHDAMAGAPIRSERLPVTLVTRGTTAERR